MKKTILTLLVIAAGVIGYASIPFASAGENDFYRELTRSEGYNEELSSEIEKRMDQNESDVVSVMIGHKQLIESGESGKLFNVASIRKSLISALYGIAESKGLVDLNQSLGDLKIDDEVNPLTEKEKEATIADLLKARSGVYLNSIGESEKMKETRPERGSHAHNDYYYYNNWDFNTLGVIFEQETDLTLGEAFYEWIAIPTGMKHFQPDHVVYHTSDETSIPMYRFYMSAEDLARFGSLYANEGTFENTSIIPREWIEASFTSYSAINDVDQFSGYGYLWWLDDNNEPVLQWAVGSGGQFLIIDRKNNLSLVLLNNTGTSPIGNFLYRNLNGEEESYSEAREVYRIVSESVISQ